MVEQIQITFAAAIGENLEGKNQFENRGGLSGALSLLLSFYGKSGDMLRNYVTHENHLQVNLANPHSQLD